MATTDGQSDGMVLIYCPCPDLSAAKKLGHELLDARLAGCINILPAMVSLFDWQGVREEAEECVLIAKTSAERGEAIAAFLRDRHPYDVPAILVLPLAGINEPYRQWLSERIG